MRIVRIAVGVVLGLLVALTPAHAAKRVALVIGNDRYAALPQLRNAVADARLVAETLKTDLQFQVFTGENLDYRATNRLHADFEAAISPGDTAFVFFAGHGVAFGAENYLLPTDTEKPRTGEENLVRSEAHAVDSLIRRVQARGAVASFFVIDACRDNPFEAVGVRSIGGSRGLARADVPTGVFVLFSAGIGQTALDRLNETESSPNSVFTRTLVPLLRQPGLTHLSVAKRVQTEVRALAASVGHQQQPAFYDQIDGEVVLKAGVQGATPQAGSPVAPPAVQSAAVAPSSRPAAPQQPVLGGDFTITELMTPGPLGDQALGAVNAPVSMIEYASMTCPHCSQFHAKIFPEVKKKYIDTGKVRFIFREFPLDPLAAAGSMLARCAGNDSYFPIIETLFSQQKDWVVSKPLEPMFAIAKRAGFTQQTFDACLANQKMLDGIENTRTRAAQKFHVNSVPTFFINGKIFPGALTLEEIDKHIAPHLKE
jgi:protein-disulfide isomerase